MADKDDPRVRDLIAQWLIYAEENGIPTSNRSETPPTVGQVLDFLTKYLKEEKNMRMVQSSVEAVQRRLIASAREMTHEEHAHLNRLKQMIDTKMNPAVKKQLVRELTSE